MLVTRKNCPKALPPDLHLIDSVHLIIADITHNLWVIFDHLLYSSNKGDLLLSVQEILHFCVINIVLGPFFQKVRIDDATLYATTKHLRIKITHAKNEIISIQRIFLKAKVPNFLILWLL